MYSKKNIIIINLLVIIKLFFLQTTSGAKLDLVTISATPNTVNQLANYTISITPTYTTIPTNGRIVITFPNTYTLPSGTKSCTISGTTITTPICTAYNANNSIVITNFGGKNPGNMQITIYGLINPYTDAKSSFFQVATQTNTGDTLDYNYEISNWQISPDTITGATLAASNQIAGQSGSLIITFTPTNSIPQGGYITMNIPTYNGASGATGTSLKSMITSSNPFCSASSGIENTILCTFSSTSNQLFITNGFLKNSSYSSQIRITIQSFLNPYSTSPKNGFIISTGYNNGNIDQSASLSLTITQAGSITSSSLFLSNTVINSMASYTFSIITSLYVESGTILQLVFPTGLTSTNVQSIMRISPTAKILSFVTSQNVVNITNPIDYYIDPPLIMVFQVNYIKNPGTTNMSEGFSILLLDSNGKPSQTIISPNSLRVQATPGIITIVNILPTSRAYKALTTYTFTITLSNPLSSSATLTISFITLAKVINGNQNCLSGNTNLAFINKTAVCQITNNNTVQINNFLLNNYTPNQEVITIIINSVTNPASTEPSTFTITSTDNGFTIDTIANTPMTTTLNPDSITTYNSQSIMKYTANFTYDYGQYDFQFLTTNPIPITGSIVIIFPNSMIVLTSTICSNLNGFINTPSCLVNTTTNQITISNGFTSSQSTSNTAPIKFSIIKIRNPRSMSPSSSVIIQTLNSNGYVIDQINTTLIVTANAASKFLASTNLSSVSQINGKITVYTLNLYPFVVPINSDYYVIKAPSEITVLSNTNCQANSANIAGFIKCNPDITANTLTIQITFISQLNNGDSFSLNITNIQNQQAVSTSNPITITQYDANNALIQNDLGVLRVTTITPSQFQTFNMNINSLLIATQTSYTFTIVNTLSIPQNAYIKISFSQDFIITQANIATASSNLGTMKLSSTAGSLILSSLPIIPPGSTLNFTISNITNPITPSKSYTLTISTYNGSNLIIESSQISQTYTCISTCSNCSGLAQNCTSCSVTSPYSYNFSCFASCPTSTVNIIGFACNQCTSSSNCNTCSANNVSQCTSCLSSYPYQSIVDNRCYQTCPSGQYAMPSSFICKACDSNSNCATCNPDNTAECYSCSTNFPYLNQLDNKCYATCPDGTVPTTDSSNTNICQACDSGSMCKRCQIANLSICESCTASSPYLANNKKCYLTCPENTVAQTSTSSSISDTLSCLACTATTICSTCDPNNLSKCLSCPVSTPLLNIKDSFCYSQCTSGTTQAGNFCVPCSSNCQECASGQPNNCTSCPTASKLLSSVDNKCYSTCPTGTYSTSTTCQACNSSCFSCVDDPNSCTLCSNNLYLFGSQCLTSCPSNYIAINSTCFSADCALGCSLCKSDGTCSQCQTGFFNINGTCAKACPSGYYPIEANYTCGKCLMDNCSTCNEANPESCSLCVSGFVISPNKTMCIEGCPISYFPSNGTCTACGPSCANCLSPTSCTLCLTDYYVNNGMCIYAIRHPKVAAGFPIPFLIFSLLTLAGLLYIEYKHRENLFFNNAMALLSIWQFIAWFILMILFFVEEFNGSGVICILGMLANWALNAGFYLFYKKKIIMKDEDFQEWRLNSLRVVKYIECISYGTSLKFLRIIFGKIMRKPWAEAYFKDEELARKIFQNFALITLITTDFPILLADYLNFSSIDKDSQLFYSALETFIITGALIALTILSYTIFYNEGFKKKPIIIPEPVINEAALDETKSFNALLQASGGIGFKHPTRGKISAKGIASASPDPASEVYGIFSGEKYTKSGSGNDSKLKSKAMLDKIMRDLENLKNEERISKIMTAKQNLTKPSDQTNLPRRRRSFSHEGIEHNDDQNDSDLQGKRQILENYLRRLAKEKIIIDDDVFYAEEQVSKIRSARKLKNINNIVDLNMNLNNTLNANEEFEMSYAEVQDTSIANLTQNAKKSPKKRINQSPIKDRSSSSNKKTHNPIYEEYTDIENGDFVRSSNKFTNKLTSNSNTFNHVRLNESKSITNYESVDNNEESFTKEFLENMNVGEKSINNSAVKSKNNSLKQQNDIQNDDIREDIRVEFLSSNQQHQISPAMPNITIQKNIPRSTRVVDNNSELRLNLNTNKSLTNRGRNNMLNNINDDVQRLMKLTVINHDYKRNLQNNQIVKKSNYGYDQIKNNPVKKDQLKKMHNEHVDEILEIKNRSIKGNTPGVLFNNDNDQNDNTPNTNESMLALMNDNNIMKFGHHGGSNGGSDNRAGVNGNISSDATSTLYVNKPSYANDSVLKDIESNDVLYLDKLKDNADRAISNGDNDGDNRNKDDKESEISQRNENKFSTPSKYDNFEMNHNKRAKSQEKKQNSRLNKLIDHMYEKKYESPQSYKMLFGSSINNHGDSNENINLDAMEISDI